MSLATEQDWYEEYLRLCMAIAVVANVDEAIAHINHYSTKHSDSIITADEANARKFLRGVDSAAVYWNASTRFTDGAEFGFGAEMGISTQKLHCRGPFALAGTDFFEVRDCWDGAGSVKWRLASSSATTPDRNPHHVKVMVVASKRAVSSADARTATVASNRVMG